MRTNRWSPFCWPAGRRSKPIARAIAAIALPCLAIAALPSHAGNAANARPSRALPAPEHLSSEARAEIRARMGRHGVTMSSLVHAVILLDRPAIRTLANRIAEEEIVARVNAPTKSGKPLPLPSQFFAELDALRETAQELAAAAAQPHPGTGNDDRELADRFAALAKTCVGCHSAYLRGGLDAEPPAPPPEDVPQQAPSTAPGGGPPARP